MPKPTAKTSPAKGATGGSGSSANFALLSPVKVENTTSLEALRFELSLVQSAIKGGHKDAATVQRGRQVRMEDRNLSPNTHTLFLFSLFCTQIQARMETLKQRLQSDPRFRQAFAKQVAKELQVEQQLEAQLAKQVRSLPFSVERKGLTLNVCVSTGQGQAGRGYHLAEEKSSHGERDKGITRKETINM